MPPSSERVGVSRQPAARLLAWALYAAAAAVFLLFAYGWSLAPLVVPAAPSAVLIAYIGVAYLSEVVDSEGGTAVPLVTLACGSISAAMLIRADVIQYFGRKANNTTMVVVVAGVWLVAGIATAARTRRVRNAVLSSTLAAAIGSLANVAFILASYYVLKGSALQDQFFRTEGTYDDFARSGARDFGVFVIGDLFGGAFFHLLFGGLLGALLGMLGGALTAAVSRFRRSSSIPLDARASGR
jgi:hypothetical protein